MGKTFIVGILGQDFDLGELGQYTELGIRELKLKNKPKLQQVTSNFANHHREILQFFHKNQFREVKIIK